MATGVTAAEPPSTHDQFVDGPWGPVRLRVVGKPDRTTAILLHQVIWSSDQLRAAQDVLAARGVPSIAIDLPGNGLSRGPDEPVALEAYGEVLGPVLKSFGLASAKSTFTTARAWPRPNSKSPPPNLAPPAT